MANLLITRLQEPKKTMASIAMQAAVETIGQLTQRHVDMLTGIFVVLKIHVGGAPTIDLLRLQFALAFGPVSAAVVGDQDVIRHLDATACIAFDTTRSHNLVTILRNGYPNAFTRIPASFNATDGYWVPELSGSPASGTGRPRAETVEQTGRSTFALKRVPAGAGLGTTAAALPTPASLAFPASARTVVRRIAAEMPAVPGRPMRDVRGRPMREVPVDAPRWAGDLAPLRPAR